MSEEQPGVVIDGESYSHRPDHATDETGQCAPWCKACRLERVDRKSVDTKQPPGIEGLRDVVKWCDWQREDHWLPEDGRNPTITQIVLLHSLCRSWGVDTPEDLAAHDNPKARAAWAGWNRTRGPI